MISFIEFADYIVGPVDSFCKNGKIDNLSECEKAAKKLNFHFEKTDYPRVASNRPGGCYVENDNTVEYNNDFNGTSYKLARPICRQGK